MSEEAMLKNAGTVPWSDLSGAEDQLVQRCVDGDEVACADLVAQHEPMVHHLALSLLGNRDDALEVSQEVFLRVFRTLHRFRGQSALRTWIYRIVVNQSRNRLRSWRRRHRSCQISLDEHLAKHGELAGRPAGAPDRVLRQKELATRVWAALDRLPFDQKTAIVLREIEGLSYQEIAFSLHVVVGTVKSRLARARETLRQDLRDEP